MCKNSTTIKTVNRSLTRRAVKTMANAFLVNITQFFVNFFITPIIILGLGAELYGAWQMILQVMQYLARGDLRPMGTLRIFLAVRQHKKDEHEKQRLIGAALIITLCMIPIILTIGFILVNYAGLYIHVEPKFHRSVQLAMIISILCIALDKLLGLPGSVLAGMNLEYKAMGLNAFTLLVSSLFSVAAIKFGFGLPGLAMATLVGVVITGTTRFFVAKHFIQWFAAAVPKKTELKSFVNKSGWFFGASMADALINVSDLLIVGIILEPAAAAIYATTGAVLRFTSAPIIKILNSVSAGIGDLCGRREWRKLFQIRAEMHLIAIIILTILGSGVILLNRDFLSIWIGKEFYGGNVLNLLLVLVAFCKIVIRPDEIIIENLMLFKEQSYIKLITGFLLVVSGIFFTNIWGMTGLAASVLSARIFLIICYSTLINRHSDKNLSTKNFMLLARPFVILCAALFVSYASPYDFIANRWLSFFINCFVISFILFILTWFLSLNTANKNVVKNRLSVVKKVFSK